MATMVEVELQRGRADQRRQLAGCHAAHQVHCEEAFLRMHIAERVADVACGCFLRW